MVMMIKYAINTITENPFAPSGAQGYYFHVINEMKKHLNPDEILYVFCSKANYHIFEKTFSDKIKPVVFPFSNEKQKLRVISEHFNFPKKISELSIDVYNCGNLAPFYVPRNCSVVSTIKTMHAFTNPSSMSKLKQYYRVILGKRTVKRASFIISNSQSNSQDILEYFPVNNNKIRLVYEALDHSIFKAIQDKSVNDDFLKKHNIVKPFILFVSSLYKYKNAEALISAYSKLENRNNYQLVIVGFPREQDYYLKLLSNVKELGLTSNIIFAGGVQLEDTAKFYQSAEIFVYPSKYETFGLTILESMACGCPVITSNVSSMPEIGGEAAVLIDPTNVFELKEQLNEILGSVEKRKRLIAAGIKRASMFDWNLTAKNTLDVYREAFNAKEQR